MRFGCSMVAFVDGRLPFDSLVFHHQYCICLFIPLGVSSAGFSRRFRTRSSTSDFADAGRFGWKCRMRPTVTETPMALFTAFLQVFLACSTILVSTASARYSSQTSVVCAPPLFLGGQVAQQPILAFSAA